MDTGRLSTRTVCMCGNDRGHAGEMDIVITLTPSVGLLD